MFEEGDKCIYQYNNWFNAYGDLVMKLNLGDRVTVSGSHRIGGAIFLRFKEYPEYSFLSTGFKSVKTLN